MERVGGPPRGSRVAVAAIFFVNGAVLDVSMNAQAVVIERRYRRSIMSSFHALWSLGGVAGAALAGPAMSLGTPPAPNVVAIAIVATAVVVGTLGWLLPSEPRRAG